MARIRTIQPQLPSDRKLATVEREARYTFVLCFTVADDDGLFRAEPRQLLGQLYPHDADVDEARLEAWLALLTGLGVLRWRFTRDGARVGEIVNWKRHQKIDKPSRSFLLNQLTPFEESSRVSGEAPRGPSERPESSQRMESGVLSLESGVGRQESLGGDIGTVLRENLHSLSAEGYLKASQNPGATAAVIRSFGPGGTDGRFTWEQIDRALTEMAAASVLFNQRALGGFLRKLKESPDGNPSRQAPAAGAISEDDATRQFRLAGLDISQYKVRPGGYRSQAELDAAITKRLDVERRKSVA